MIIFYEIKKIMNSSVIRITAITLLFVCAMLSYFAIQKDDSTHYTADEIQQSYDRQMQLHIESAKRGLTQLNGLGEEDDYAHEYYERIIALYTEVSDGKTIKNESAVGWNDLLTSDNILLLSLAMAIMIGGISIFEEKRTGSISVVFASKNGRLKTAIGKTAAVIAVSALFCVLFTTVSTVVYFASGHLSSGLAELQTAESFRFSPYNITLWSCLLRLTGFRMLLAALFGVLTAVFSELLSSYILIFSASILHIAAEYLVFRIKYVGVDIFIKNVNIFSIGGSYLFERYYSVRLFGCADATSVNFILTLVLIALTSILLIVLFSLRMKQSRLSKARKLLLWKKRPLWDIIPKTLFGWEAKKNLLHSYVLVIAAACIAATCILSVNTYGKHISTEELIYRQYCETYEKMPLDDAFNTIFTEMERIDNGSHLYDEATSKIMKGEITDEEYAAMIEEYGYCKAHELAILRCAQRVGYLRSVDSSLQHEVRYIYDGTLNELLNGEFSLILLLLLLFCLSAVFSREHESRVYPIVRTYKNGQSRTFLTKLLFATSVTALLFLLLTAIDVIVCASNGAFANADASVLSLMAARYVSLDISIGEYLLIMYLLRFASYELFAIILTSLSAITRKTIASSVFVSVLVFVPYIINKLESVPLAVNLSSFMSANKVLLSPDVSPASFSVLPLFAGLLLILAWFRFTAKGKGA